MDILVILGLSLLAFIVIIMIVANISKTNKKEVDRVNEVLQQKYQELEHINEEIKNKTVDHTYSLSRNALQVLDIYEQSGIKIPLDILEEVSQSIGFTQKEIYDFIESQRQNWKLENSKKTIRKVK